MDVPSDLIPIEIWTTILKYICVIDLKNIQLTCNEFNSISEKLFFKHLSSISAPVLFRRFLKLIWYPSVFVKELTDFEVLNKVDVDDPLLGKCKIFLTEVSLFFFRNGKLFLEIVSHKVQKFVESFESFDDLELITELTSKSLLIILESQKDRSKSLIVEVHQNGIFLRWEMITTVFQEFEIIHHYEIPVNIFAKKNLRILYGEKQSLYFYAIFLFTQETSGKEIKWIEILKQHKIYPQDKNERYFIHLPIFLCEFQKNYFAHNEQPIMLLQYPPKDNNIFQILWLHHLQLFTITMRSDFIVCEMNSRFFNHPLNELFFVVYRKTNNQFYVLSVDLNLQLFCHFQSSTINLFEGSVRVLDFETIFIPSPCTSSYQKMQREKIDFSLFVEKCDVYRFQKC
jgi:hypothetical protein